MSKSWKRSRREAYLNEWPMHAQLEALTDAAAGDPTKLDLMRAQFADIKKLYPKPTAEAAADARASDHVGFWRRRADELERAGRTAEANALRIKKGVVQR
jgi:hypothetical protein